MSFGEQRHEEISALISIFGDEVEVEGEVVRISIDRGCGIVLCTFNLPAGYPRSALPVLDLSGAVLAQEAASAEQELVALFHPGLQHPLACSHMRLSLHKLIDAEGV